MIQFDFDWSDTLSLISLATAAALLPLQLWLLVFRPNAGTSGQKWGLKLLLNVIFWLSMVAFVLRPEWRFSKASTTGIVAGNEVPMDFVRHLRDSLPHSEILSVTEIQKISPDTLLLVGAGFSSVLFSSLQQSATKPAIRWVPWFAPDNPYQVTWKGLLRKGELQEVRGRVKSSRKQVLKLAFGRNTLDSMVLNEGDKNFRLRFPAFAEGRTSVTLTLAGQKPDTLRFFARAAKPLAIRFILDSPDFESRNLAAWLGKNGHSVIYDVDISKDLQSTIKLNAAKAPDLIITSPAGAGNVAVKRALAQGADVLFVGLIDPDSEIRKINAAAGTHFQLRRLSNEPVVKVLPGLDALPYRFVPAPSQTDVPGLPAAVEKRKGKVAVSLLGETFPMQLSGDTTAYQKVWSTVLSYLQSPEPGTVEITAPVFSGTKSSLGLNNFGTLPEMLLFGSDTLFPARSPFNPNSGTAEFIPVQTGWITLRDSVASEIFIEKDADNAKARQLELFVSSYTKQHSGLAQAELQTKSAARPLPEWAWYLWLMICFAALWIEAKFS